MTMTTIGPPGDPAGRPGRRRKFVSLAPGDDTSAEPPPRERRRTDARHLDERRTIGFLIADVARMMRSAFDRRVRRIGLTRAQWQVLSLLHRRPGLSQSELAEMLEVERATAGRMIDRLEQKGWLVRRRDPADRRTWRLHLTAEAEEVQAEMGMIAARMIDDAMGALRPGEREALTEMLERVKGQLQGMAPRGAPAAEGEADDAPPRRHPAAAAPVVTP